MILTRSLIGPTFVLVMLMSLMMGVTMGISADGPAEATIDVDQRIEEMDFVRSEEEVERRTRQQLGPLGPAYAELQRFEVDMPADPYIRAGVIEFTKTMLWMALTLADWGAFVGYHYLSWMPAIVIQGFVQLTMLAAVAWILYREVGRLNDMREAHQ